MTALVRPSPNFDTRPEATPIDMLVLHYTGMESAEAALQRPCDPAAPGNDKVSAHYLIDEDGSVISMVEENNRAWHAGVAFWRGETNINGRSIGIELVNPGDEFGYGEFPDAQMAALQSLAGEILCRHPIEARNVVGHSDVAPGRKTDPGERFGWRRLAAAGIGLWPDGGEDSNPETTTKMLATFGYDVTDPDAAVAAFQRHFSPESLGGPADGTLAGRLGALLDLCG